MAPKQARRTKLLSSTRPRVPASASKPIIPSLNKAKSTRTIIRTHHTLHKRLAGANDAGDASLAAQIKKDIDTNGGLEIYQKASLSGQKQDRGGDSSKFLVKWLFKTEPTPLLNSDPTQGKFRVLEIGALDPNNAITRLPCMIPTRIDLKSQHKSIISQDFMKRPEPTSDSDQFDIISLSLVLNYVPDPKTRGQMLRRCAEFLSEPSKPSETDQDTESSASPRPSLPFLFLVLPRPCIDNSRYLTWTHLKSIMAFLGFDCVQHKLTTKLSYSLWQLTSSSEWDNPTPEINPFKKNELLKGNSRNNFCIILE